MLQTNAKPDASEPFEDYSLFVYRQTAPHFQDRVKDLEKKFTYVPVRIVVCFSVVLLILAWIILYKYFCCNK